MEKQRKWQFALILAVIAITIYNILPTVFYYLKPLKEPIGPAAAEKIATSIEKRVLELENETKDWLRSYCNLIQTKPLSISNHPENPRLAVVSFVKSEDARRFRAFLPRAGSLIPFAPAQVSLVPEDGSKEVLVERKLPLHLKKEWFTYAPKNDPAILADRIQQIIFSLTESNDTPLLLNYLQRGDVPFPAIEALAAQIHSIAEVFGDENALAARYASRLIPRSIQESSSGSADAVQTLIASFDRARDAIRQEKARLSDPGVIAILDQKESKLLSAETYLKKHSSWFSLKPKTGIPAWDQTTYESIDLSGCNPLFSSLSFDLSKDRLVLNYHPNVLSLRKNGKESFEQMLIDEAAKIARVTNEDLIPGQQGISISLHRLTEPSGYLILDQRKLAAAYAQQIRAALATMWHPKHPDLQHLPVADYGTFRAMSPEQQALCIVITSQLETDLPGLKQGALYVVAKGMDRIAKTYESFPNSDLAQAFSDDIRALAEILYRDGFAGYSGSSLSGNLVQDGDVFFEKPNCSNILLSATREDFIVRGTQKMALIELSDRQHRILAENKIETLIHADLLKWKDDYFAAQVSIDPNVRFDFPKPTKSIFWNNLALSARKFIRGDERKIIRWGLDLSGGKTVQIELRDSRHQVVKNDADLKQGINELYNRVNKMGVSEVSIRQVEHRIVLDFPGSQAMSAGDLIKASTMDFHVVNEKFSTSNPALGDSVNRFLQEVWNEASVTGRKDPQSVSAIAFKHLHTADQQFRSESAQTLWDSGLRLSPPDDLNVSSNVDDSISKIVQFRGNTFSDWHNQSHPLLIVFRNRALEGANLDNIRSGYDPSKGNFLSFEVSGASAKNALHAWTSRYSKEKILGTDLENHTRGRGWRMAALLNDAVISSPGLESALRDSAMISGSFSQREANQLTADLKAGSLTFTPHILSEKNVSPELGKADRIKGITATCAALCLVIGSMVAYYRFAGLIASIAVIFNLLILWATLQNLGATLTLAGLAGVILTVGMAVDANVLVFERIKEEFARTGKIAAALNAGYKKAYSAIVDSNITTIIAALILLNFDAGPIKSFAVNLIIGIVSSMFTALFMTRFYFTGWAQNPKHVALKMADWIRSTNFDFLKWAKPSFAAALAIILAGCSLVIVNRNSIFGMDFTGGYALNLELESGDIDKVRQALLSAGATNADFQIRELNAKNYRVLFGTGMEQPGKPFYRMPIEAESSTKNYLFEKNPRIAWTVKALQNGNVLLSSRALPQLHSQWAAMSGQMSDSMRNNALIGLLLSFVCIFIYLAFRFEYKFAAAALICLMHDVWITLGCVGLLYSLGLGIQIDLNTIAALMTIIGYSLNDTIIIFDRIREEMHSTRKRKLSELVNHALNATLSRTAITSGTTLLVLIALVALGGASIFSFALVMTIGVFFGTLSSWFIAAPLMIYFHKRERAAESSLMT